MNHDESLRRLRRGLSRLLTHQPFFGSLALRLPLISDAECRTVVSDGSDLRVNPAWVARADADSIQLAVAHVVLACGLKHHLRRGDRTYRRWQRASHLVTLPFLRDEGLTDESGGLSMSVEQAYDTLPPDPVDGEDGGDDPHGPGAAGEVQDAPAPDRQGQGEEAGGEVQAVLRVRGREEVQKERAQEWDQALHQAVAMAKAQGHAPGSLKTQIEAMHHSQTPWDMLLRRFMLAAAKTDYTWSRPNYRYLDSGLYLPALHAPAVGDLVFAVDTSESLDTAALARMWGEILAVASQLTPNALTVIQCDVAVHAVDTYSPYDLPTQFTAVGRGGTEFCPVFAELERHPTPTCLIYFTDLYCTEYPAPPNYPVLWAVTGQASERYTPPFGERIDID